MESDFMNITEKIEQRRSEVEEALSEEMRAIDQALPKLRRYLTEKIESEINSFKIDMQKQENEHYQTLLLHLFAIERELKIKVEVKRNKNGELVNTVYDLREGVVEKIEKLKFWE